ncbi:IS3 family transposase [Paenibacillus popilliae]|uniref:IS3 family transposase n=1 Tax=Paenibacillus popilliae TaxID=78057 RepID=UPI003F56B36F
MFRNLGAGGTTQKYRAIKEAAVEYNVRDLCKVFGVSRSGYYIRSLDEAQRRIEEYIHFYNHNRPQRKLKKLPPVEYRRQLAA